jgi:hypothetical protein
VLQIPQLGAQGEVRPDLRLEYGGFLTFVVRPRLQASVTDVQIGERLQTEHSTASAEWTDLSGTWRLGDSLALTYGLTNFQWGPAELLSPSNRIFHETGFARDPLYHVRGKHLVRLNASSGRELTAVLLVELADNGDPAFVSGEAFQPKGQLKVEWAAPSGGTYLGASWGWASASRPWAGEYAAWQITDGLSAYADASHTLGSRAWYPVSDPRLGVVMRQARLSEDRIRTLAAGGLRYVFEGGEDARVEYVFDESGWDKGDLDRAALAWRLLPLRPDLAGPLQSPGLEFASRQLVHLSLRLPDLPPRKKIALSLRYLRSVTDRSGAAFATGTWEVGDSTLVFLSVLASHGGEKGDLSRLVRASFVAGAVITF